MKPAQRLRPRGRRNTVLPMESRTINPPVPIDLALFGRTVADSARLRERHVLPFVLDAMVLIEDALYRTRVLIPTVRPEGTVLWPRPSALSHLIALHAIRVYGKPDLLDEVVARLPEAASRAGRDPDPALALIAADYVPHIRLVDPSGILLPDTEETLTAVAAIDPDDEPTARLSRLLDPSILLTRDTKSLLRFGFGQWVSDPDMEAFVRITHDDWLKATLQVRNRAFIAQMEVGGRLIVVSGSALAAGTRKVASLVLANPIPAALLLAGLVVLIYVSRTSPGWAELRDGLTSVARTGLAEFAVQTEGRPEAATAAATKVEAYLANHAPPELDVARVARALAIAPNSGLTAAELRAITSHSFAVRPILEAYPAFVCDETGRWHLGVPGGMLGRAEIRRRGRALDGPRG